MKKFIPDLITKDIVMISDYVSPDTYYPKELEDEKIFIQTVTKEIKEYGVNFYYTEIKNLKDLKTVTEKHHTHNTVIFNWCEYLDEKEGTASLVTEYLESKKYIFTGAASDVIKLTDSKGKTKDKLLKHKIPTPESCVIKKGFPVNDAGIHYPVIAKLEDRHASAGITSENIIYNSKQLKAVSDRLFKEYEADIMLEEFIDGPEYVATVWGNKSRSSCIYITEEKYKDENIAKISTENSKFVYGSEEEQNIDSTAIEQGNKYTNISRIAVDAYSALGFYDYGRFELRENHNGIYVIDCNPNQWLGMDAALFKGTKILGYNYGETLLQICEFAVKRYMQ